MAAGAAVGSLAGMTIAVVALVPGGVIGLGGVLALGLLMSVGGAMLGGFFGEATADRAFVADDPTALRGTSAAALAAGRNARRLLREHPRGRRGAAAGARTLLEQLVEIQ